MAVEHHPQCGWLARGGRRVGARIGSGSGDWASRLAMTAGAPPLVGEIAPADPADLDALVEHLRTAGPARMLHLAVRIPPGTHPGALTALLEHAGPAVRAVVSLRSHDPLPARWRHAGASLIVDVADGRTCGASSPEELSRILAALPDARWELNVPRDEASARALLRTHGERLGQLSLVLADPAGDPAAASPSAVRVGDAGRHRRILAEYGHVPWIVGRTEPARTRMAPR